jgi:hypothetical protein
MAVDDADGESVVRACTQAQEVDTTKDDPKGLVVNRREGGLLGRGGGVAIAVVGMRHQEERGIDIEHAVFLEEFLRVLLLGRSNSASGKVKGDVHAHNGCGKAKISHF